MIKIEINNMITKEQGKEAITSKIWIYDFRTNINFTLKENPLKEEDLGF